MENLDDTLSINHNWINGTNIKWSWKKLKNEIDAIKTSCGNEIITKLNVISSSTPSNPNDDNTSGAGQLGDDLLLLWKIISTKALSILSLSNTLNGNQTVEIIESTVKDKNSEKNEFELFSTSSSMQIFNIRAILPILAWIEKIVEQDSDYGLSRRCNCNPKILSNELKKYLNELES